MFGAPPLPLRRPTGVHSSSLATAGGETSWVVKSTANRTAIVIILEKQDEQFVYVHLKKTPKVTILKGEPPFKLHFLATWGQCNQLMTLND